MNRWALCIALMAATPSRAQTTEPADPPTPAATVPAPAATEPAPPAEAEPAPSTEADDWGESTEPGWGDDGGFEGMDDLPDVKLAPPPPPRRGSLTGFVRYDMGLGTARAIDGERPFVKDRLSLDLSARYTAEAWQLVAEIHGEYDAAYLAGRERIDAPTLDVYEARILSGQQYVAASLGPVDVTLGRQIVVWGEGDALSPLDVINPRDLREPGLADIDDLRLGVLATRIGWFEGAHRVEAMAVHESYFGERAPPLGAFSPLRAFVLSNPAVAGLLADKTLAWRHDIDRFDPAGTQAFARWVYKGEGLDVGLYGGWALDQQGVVRTPAIAALLDDDIELDLHHDRYWLAGHSGATVIDSLIIKWELVAAIDKAYNTGDADAGLSPDALGEDEATLITGMLGLTWSPESTLTVGLEAQAGGFVDGPDDLLFPADAPVISARVIKQAMREKLRILATANVFGLTGEYGWLVRAEARYALTDTASLTGGLVHYGEGDDGEIGPLYGLGDNDRVFVRLRWDFDLY